MRITIDNYWEAIKSIDLTKTPKVARVIHEGYRDLSEFYYDNKDIRELLDKHFKIMEKCLKNTKSSNKPKGVFNLIQWLKERKGSELRTLFVDHTSKTIVQFEIVKIGRVNDETAIFNTFDNRPKVVLSFSPKNSFKYTDDGFSQRKGGFEYFYFYYYRGLNKKISELKYKLKIPRDSRSASGKKKLGDKKYSPESIHLASMPIEVKVIKRYLNLHNKKVTERQVSLLYRVIQKAATEKAIRKTSKYADEIKSISSNLIKTYKEMGGTSKFTVPEPLYTKLKKIVDGPDISFIKKFIGAHRNLKKAQAQGLLTSVKHLLKFWGKFQDNEPTPTPSKTAKKNNPMKQNKKIEVLPIEVKIFKRYLKFHGKRVTDRQILLLYKYIQKAAIEKEIRKTGQYAKQIKFVGNDLSRTYNTMDKHCVFQVPKELRDTLTTIIDSYKISPAVPLLKRFVDLHGNISPAKAKRLIADIDKAKGKEITRKQKDYPKLLKVRKALENYLKTGELKTNEIELSGLRTMALKKAKAVATKVVSRSKKNTCTNKVVTATKLMKMKFQTISIRGRFGNLLGKLYQPFYIMIYGSRYHGKSSVALLFAHELVKQLRYKVLYVANEEGARGTMQEKLLRLGINSPIGIVEEYDPKLFKDYDVVLIDSTQTTDITHDEFKELKKKFPKTSFVIINQANRDGSSKGGTKWEHLVDAIMHIEDKTATMEKNRFPGGSEKPIKIF